MSKELGYGAKLGEQRAGARLKSDVLRPAEDPAIIAIVKEVAHVVADEGQPRLSTGKGETALARSRGRREQHSPPVGRHAACVDRSQVPIAEQSVNDRFQVVIAEGGAPAGHGRTYPASSDAFSQVTGCEVVGVRRQNKQMRLGAKGGTGRMRVLRAVGDHHTQLQRFFLAGFVVT